MKSTFLEKKKQGTGVQTTPTPSSTLTRSHKRAPCSQQPLRPQMVVITVTFSSAPRRFREALQRALLVFLVLVVNLQRSLTPLCAGKEQACGDGCHHAAKHY